MSKKFFEPFLSFVFVAIFVLSSMELKAQSFSKRAQWSNEFSSFLWKSRLRDWSIHRGKFSSEQEFYTDSIGNVFVRNGYLHIKATPDKREDKICSSGRVSSKGFKSFLYGKIEIKAKIPTGRGVFPAIWMLRDDHPKTFPLGEIDIMEYIECFEGRQYCTTTHIVEKGPGREEIRHRHSKMIDTDLSTFHIYGLEWTPDYLRFLLDRKEVYRLEKYDAEFWPFDDPYILILNVAYGSWGAKCGTDETIFPCEMLVDWIRYYPMIDN